MCRGRVHELVIQCPGLVTQADGLVFSEFWSPCQRVLQRTSHLHMCIMPGQLSVIAGVCIYACTYSRAPHVYVYELTLLCR